MSAAVGGIVDQPGNRYKLRPPGDGVCENADAAGDDGEDVVEVVGDAAGELTDRLHLLRLAELRLGGALLGEITANEEMTLHRFRPARHPVQDDVAAFLVQQFR